MTPQSVAKLAAIGGFCSGAGFLAAQEIWWWITGLAGFCQG